MINMLPYTTRPNSQKVDKFAYDLSSVVVHKGKLDAGHYYAYCKQGDKVYSLYSPPTPDDFLNSF